MGVAFSAPQAMEHPDEAWDDAEAGPPAEAEAQMARTATTSDRTRNMTAIIMIVMFIMMITI